MTAPGGRRRGTARGRVSPQPQGSYDAPELVDGSEDVGTTVHFRGRDGRTATFCLDDLPLAGLHADLAAAFARLAGPTGPVSTLSSARNTWTSLRRLVRFLDSLLRSPQHLGELTAQHLQAYRRSYAEGSSSEEAVLGEMNRVRQLLRRVEPADRLATEVQDFLRQRERREDRWRPGVPGYSDQVFDAVMRAARSDVVAIRQRLRSSEELMRRAREVPSELTDEERQDAARLEELAATGRVPTIRHSTNVPDVRARLQLARQLFLTLDDIAPLVILGVGLTGRNAETIKELPAEHKVLDGKAVQVTLTKRRRGPDRWFTTVHWEIGPESRQLHTPGGFYLLLHELCRRGREFSGQTKVWSCWANGDVRGKLEGGGHTYPWHTGLNRVDLALTKWAARHGILEEDQPLKLTLNRVKTSVERRHTRAAGGHLPSSTRTNTQDVLFGSYLAGDPTVRDWAEGVVGDALASAEEAVRTEHQRLLEAQGGHLRVMAGSAEAARDDVDAAAQKAGISPDAAKAALSGDTDTAFMSCQDIENSPVTPGGGACKASFLACFSCRNAVATEDHLPSLLALQDDLAARWDGTEREAWWRRYGQAWVAIAEDIVPAFTPAEVARAAERKPSTTPLDLLEGPKEDR